MFEHTAQSTQAQFPQERPGFIPARVFQDQFQPPTRTVSHQRTSSTGLSRYPVQAQRRTAVSLVQDSPSHNGHVSSIYSDDLRRRADLAIAATYYQGEARERLLTDAAIGGRNQRNSAKEREVENLRRWAGNPSSTSLREIGPSSILKGIFSIKDLANPPAEIFYTMLAF